MSMKKIKNFAYNTYFILFIIPLNNHIIYIEYLKIYIKNFKNWND